MIGGPRGMDTSESKPGNRNASKTKREGSFLVRCYSNPEGVFQDEV